MQGGVLERSVSATPFAILDVETTGLNAGADRIIEVAIVRRDPGQPPRLVLDTLVNPHRPVAATEIHGITDDDVQDAPDFEAITGEVTKALSDCVVATYNVYFDMRFLTDEFGRVGIRKRLPHVCLMYMRPLLGLGTRQSLKDACAAHGIPHDNLHIASGDAQACSRLMDLYLRTLQERGVNTFAQLAALSDYKFLQSLRNRPLSASEVAPPKARVPHKRRSVKPTATDSAAVRTELQRLALATYWDALTAALADLDISEEERRLLEVKKKELGLRTEQVRMLHARAFAAALNQFTDDERLDDKECEQLAKLYYCLRCLGWAPGH